MSRTHCEHCAAMLTPGAPFCLSCFMPLEDSPPAAAAAAAPAEAAPLAAPLEAPAPAAVGAAAPGGDFFCAPAPPAASASHPGQGGDWRAAAPAAALLAARPRPARSRTPLVAGAVVGVLLLVGAVAGARAIFRSPSDKATFANAFREGRPPDFLPAFPDFSTFDTAGPEGPGDAKAYVQAVDARVRAGNAGLLALQGTLDRWADGDASDDDVRAGVRALDATLAELDAGGLMSEAPRSTRRGLGKLQEATGGYRLALGSLQDWMDSKSNGARLTFRLTVGTANVDWDSGVIALYRAGGLPAPPLPHPQPEG